MQHGEAESHAAALVVQSEQRWKRRKHPVAQSYEHRALPGTTEGRNSHVSGSRVANARGSMARVIRGTAAAAALTATSNTRYNESDSHAPATILGQEEDRDRDAESLEDVSRSGGDQQWCHSNGGALLRSGREFGGNAHQAQQYEEFSDRRQQQPKRAARRDISFTAMMMQQPLDDADLQDQQSRDSEQLSDSSNSSSDASHPQTGELNHRSQAAANRALATITTLKGGTSPPASLPCQYKSSSPQPPSELQLPGPKGVNTRYLREIDRQSILSRIGQGEKQAHLAREFKVSRAAICHLNKHRNDIIARRDDGKLLAKHPQKKHKAHVVTLHQATTAVTTNGGSDTSSLSFHELKTRSALLLLTKVHDRKSSDEEFKRTTDRLVRLLTEEALALVPMKQVHVKLQNRTTLNGFCIESSVCAVTMEQVATPLLDAFHVLEPTFASGFLRLITTTSDPSSARTDKDFDDDSSPEDRESELYFLDAHLPASLAGQSVLLLDITSSSTDLVGLAIEKILSHGALESRITLVALFVASEVLVFVQLHFPNVRIVTAEVDEQQQDSSAAVEEGHEASKTPKQKLASRASLFLVRYESLLLQEI